MKLEVQKLQEDLQCSEEKCSQLENQVKQVRIFSVTLFRRFSLLFTAITKGAQWLSGRVFDSRPRGCKFKPRWCHCVCVLEQDTLILA